MLMYGLPVQLKYGGMDLSCRLDGDALFVAEMRSEAGGAPEATGLHAGDTIRAIDGAAPSVLVRRGIGTSATMSVRIRPANNVISGGRLTTVFVVGSEKLDFEVECPHQKATRSIWLP